MTHIESGLSGIHEERISNDELAQWVDGAVDISWGQGSVDYDQRVILSRVPERFMSAVPQLYIFAKHCGGPISPESLLHGDIRVEVASQQVLDDTEVRQIFQRLNLTPVEDPRQQEVDRRVFLTQEEIPPLPLLLYADPTIIPALAEQYKIPMDNYSLYFGEAGRTLFYSLIHAAYEGGMPKLSGDLSYQARVNATKERFPFTEFMTRIKKAKRMLRPAFPQNILGKGNTSAGYFRDKRVSEWVNKCPKAKTDLYGMHTYLGMTGGVQTYLDFLRNAQNLFPDYDFGTLDETTQTLRGMLLRGCKFQTESGIHGDLYFSRDTGICTSHAETMAL